MPSSRPALGALLMSVATLGFAGMAAMVKLMDTALPEPELVFWRAALSLPLLMVLILRSRHAFVVQARWTMLWRTLFGVSAMLCFFYAVGRLTLAEAQMLIKIQPVWVALALFAMTGQMFMTGAYEVAAAPLVATVGYLSIPVASLLDWLLWGTVPTWWAAAGGALIIGAGVVLSRSHDAGARDAPGIDGQIARVQRGPR
jgi:drug/metabolite transporter (DMT)-like permease